MLDLTATAKFVAASEKISTFPNAPPGLIDENTEKIIDAARRELDRGYQGPEELNLRRLQLNGWSVEDLMAHFGITDPTVGNNLFALYIDGKLPVQDLLGAEFTQAIKNLDSEELINNIFQDIVAKPAIFEVLLGSDGVRAWEVLGSGPRSVRSNINNLAFLERISHRFSHNGNFSWDALAGFFDNQTDIEGALDQLRQADEFFDKSDEFGFTFYIGDGGEKIIEITGGEEWSRIGRGQGFVLAPLDKDAFDDASVRLLDEESLIDRSAAHISPLILGRDDVVTVGAMYPTQPGVLDVHVHGGGMGDEFRIQINRANGTKRIDLTAYQFADIIRSRVQYSNATAVRLFCCYGDGGGQEIANLLNKPVLTSTYNPIYVDLLDGRMSMQGGSLQLFLPE